MAAGKEHSRSVGWIVDMGYDFPAHVRDLIASWDTHCVFREDPDRQTTKGWNGYEANEKRVFKYLTPKIRIGPQSLTPELVLSNTFHMSCSADRCYDIVQGILERRRELSEEHKLELRRPIFVWEPFPDSCRPEELSGFYEVIRHVDVVSPNELEMGSYFGNSSWHVDNPRDQELSRSVVRSGIGIDGNGVLVVRAGREGCYAFSRGDQLALPAYLNSRVVDPTGAGNAFLGALCQVLAGSNQAPIKAAREIMDESEDWRAACVTWDDRENVLAGLICATVAASYVIEQVGVPVLSCSPEGEEYWNGTSYVARTPLEYFGPNVCFVGASIPSAGEETAWLWELVSEFVLRAVVEEQCGKPEGGSADNERIELPVGGLSVPAARGRPDPGNRQLDGRDGREGKESSERTGSLDLHPFSKLCGRTTSAMWCICVQRSARCLSSVAAPVVPDHDLPPLSHNIRTPSPPLASAVDFIASPKLSSLHARLSLPERLPLQTLARTLIDASADTSTQFNNHSFSVLGNDLLSYYTTEHLICQYPRLPMSVLWTALYAYIGPKALAVVAREWGVEHAAEPGSEVDPAYLQFRIADQETLDKESEQVPPGISRAPLPGEKFRRGLGSLFVNDSEFTEGRDFNPNSYGDPITPTQASANFVRALMGAIYLHGGRPAAKTFFEEHFKTRQLPIADLFGFSQPTRDLSKLCKREGFEAPVAKIISETGRMSRHPVYIVGIYSGKDKLGEGAGASLSEARVRAAVAALKSWYLYSPLNARVPSSMEEEGAQPWKRAHIDPGEIIV
ncbi:uncharacterized protein GIQ15_05405 [Arthroderma uncinatum]|uniref:uncharacterized protein n=1 Tax=Arthroderma uncinatum TaxID=74035 RepID=UPI00144A5948|nr:uncharacterized protein GIQ15_05405 [Arthroderma uncinatum]KAF3480058.1 hypothetical protein GIQ15_05405 [Arthroderma uncinatum]